MSLKLANGVYRADNGSKFYLIRVVDNESIECITCDSHFNPDRYNDCSAFHDEWGKYEPASTREFDMLHRSIEAGVLIKLPKELTLNLLF